MSTYCYECGQRLVPGARYCAACGQPTPPSNHTRETKRETSYQQTPRPEPQQRSYAEPASPKRAWPWGWIVIAVIVGGIILWNVIDGQSTKDDINAQNQAAAVADIGTPTRSPTPKATSTPRPVSTAAGNAFPDDTGSAEDVYVEPDLRLGDCVVEKSGSFLASKPSIEKVSCSSDEAEFIVAKWFIPSRAGRYPGEAYFSNAANAECPMETESFLFPSPEGWGRGDRKVTCLAFVR